MSKTNALKRLTMLGAMMAAMMAALPAMGQAVIMNGNYYLTHNEDGTSVNTTATTTFDPATCLWAYASRDYIRTANSSGEAINNNNNYLQYTSVSLGTDWGNWRRGGNEEGIHYRTGSNWTGYTYYYLRLNGTTWQISNSSDGNGMLYNVTITSQAATSTNPTISGADVLTAAGNTTYTASGASYRAAYTNYYFRTANHYFDANGNSFTGAPANATIGTAAWSLTDNSYATVNSSGVVNVSSLPESDITLTLTVTYPVTGGTPAAPANTTLTASKVITIQGTKPSAPTITVNGTNVTLATTAAGSTSIRYTLDGTDPTATTGTVYSGAIDLSGSTTSPVTIKAVTVRNGNASEVSEQTVTLTLPEPTITINGEAQTATITSSVAGATIYYTTDGSTPTTSSSQYSGTLTGLAYMTTVKAIAVKDGWNNSPVASGIVTIPSGVSDGVVTLFDYEPHTWVYYSDSDSPVHRLNPADIKITYRGYGNNTMTGSNTDQKPANSAFNQNVANTAVQVNKGEAGHTFVYYRTLENANEDGSGDYPYTMIPNPFQVRPTYGTSNKYRGFYAWRVYSMSSGLKIKVNGTEYSTAASVPHIYAEQEVEFVTSSATGNEIVFEALWAQAYLDDATNYYSNDGGNYRNAYERNFKKVTSLSTYSYPVTISSIEPDGNGTVGSVSRTSNYTCSQDVKLENMNLSMGNYYINANSYNLAIGRGVANGNNNVATAVYGDYSPNSVRGDFTLRVESGRYGSVYLFYYDNGTGNSDQFAATVIYGSDYDRANNEDNTKLDISGVAQVGRNVYCSNANSVIKVHVLSGKFGSNAEDVELYMGFAGTIGGSSFATRYLEVLGGECRGGIAGGIEQGVDAATAIVNMRIKGGIIHRYLYGSGQYSAGYGSRRIVITGGTFDSWVAGGCFGTGNTDQRPGTTNGNIYLYFGGNASQTNTDGIFGAGYGNYAYASGRYNVQKSNVVFADNATTTGSVYGGGNNGYCTDDIKVYLAGGSVAGSVFGGANMAPSSKAVSVTVTKGTVNGGVYGGSNQSGAISGQITVDVYGTDPQPGSGYAIHQVFGGGNVAAYSGTPVVTVHDDNSCDISIEEVYGGGNAATVTGTNVTIEGGNKIGNVFGGCYGANVTTNGTKVNVKGGTIGKVFGGNNQSGSITGGITVRVDKQSTCPMKIGELYGGGNVAASAVGSIDIGCTGDLTAAHANCNETDNRIGYELEGIGDVYGGANAAAVTGNVTLTIDSGMVYRVFGNNNTSASVSGTITVNIDKQNDACGWYVGHVYGGGNKAPYTAPNATPNHPAVNIKNGKVSHNVFGGGLGTTAAVSGNPQVTLSGTAEVGGNVYGGGDAAPVSGNTKVTLRN